MAMLTKTVTNAITGITTVEPLTAEDIAQREADLLEINKPKPEPTVAEKLESVGLTVADLKAALGL